MLYSEAMNKHQSRRGDKLTEVRDASGALLGSVLKFRGPDFVDHAPMFTAILPTGRPVAAGAQMSFDDAVALLKQHKV
jgi:hypothetical protein